MKKLNKNNIGDLIEHNNKIGIITQIEKSYVCVCFYTSNDYYYSWLYHGLVNLI